MNFPQTMLLLLCLLPTTHVLPLSALPMHPYDATTPTPQQLIQFPLVFASQRVGVQRLIQVPQHPTIFPKVTFSTWLYLTSYCKEPGNQRCAVLCRTNDRGVNQTPSIFITETGAVVFASQLTTGPADLVLSGFTLPLHRWVSIQLNLHKQQVQIVVRDRGLKEIGTLFYTFEQEMVMDYAAYGWNVGGNLWHISVAGAVGMTDIYVNQHVDVGAITWPTPIHVMFKIGNGTTPTCKMMKYNLYELIHKESSVKSPTHDLTFASDTERQHFEKTAGKVGEQLLKQAYPLLEAGRVVEGYKLLVQAECYSSVNGSYSKAVMEGPDRVPDGKEFLRASLEGHVLSNLALAFRHRFATDSDIPEDCEYALVYYERLALEAHETMNNVTLHNVWAETVKLSSVKELFDQEGESGEQHRKNIELAVEGDLEAAKRLGTQHLNGAQGRSKDLVKAYEYFKRAADDGDPQAMHETALLKINGHGTKKDEEGGVEMLMKAAEAGFVASLGGLGWFHSEHSGNITEAISYYKKGAEAGDMNSIYSLGMMYVRSDCPGGPNYKEAVVQFELAASKGHLGAVLEAGSLHKFGLGTVRSCNHAVRYYSWIAIKHDKLARLTRQALEFYFMKEYQKSFVTYQLAAEAGCETSQYNAAYITEKENSKTFHPNSAATLYYYRLSALQSNKQAELALELYNLNLESINTEVQEMAGSKHKIRTVSAASVQFRGHIHEIVFRQQDYNVSVQYSSAERMVVGVEIVSVDPAETSKTLKLWSQKLLLSTKNSYKTKVKVTIPLPKGLLQMPDKEYNVLGNTVQLRCWIANIDTWAQDKHEVYSYARDRTAIEIIGSWTSDHKFKELTMCKSFLIQLLAYAEARSNPQCPVKRIWVEKGHPFIMNGEKCGVEVKDEEYVALQEDVVTISVWFKLTNRCKSELCSILYRYDDEGSLFSPLITIDNKSKLHITVFFGKEGRIATIDKSVPLGKWVHLAVSIRATILVSCISTNSASTDPNCQYWRFNDPILYDENQGKWTMGGNIHLPGPTGYFGSLRVYRDHFFDTDKLMKAVDEQPEGIWDTNSRKGYSQCKTAS